MLGNAGRYIGGLLLFLGLLFFIVILAGFSSGFFSHSFAQSAINQIMGYTTSQYQLSNVVSPVNISSLNSTVIPQLNSKISYINCGMGCLASSYLKSVSGINLPMNNIDLYHYELIALAIAIIGAVLMFFSYEKEKKLTAIGKNMISTAILSVVIFYIPLSFIIPYLFSFPISSFSLKIPTTVLSSFSSSILSIDIIVAVIGIVLWIVSGIIKKLKKVPQQNLGTKLIVTQK